MIYADVKSATTRLDNLADFIDEEDWPTVGAMAIELLSYLLELEIAYPHPRPEEQAAIAQAREGARGAFSLAQREMLLDFVSRS